MPDEPKRAPRGLRIAVEIVFEAISVAAFAAELLSSRSPWKLALAGAIAALLAMAIVHEVGRRRGR